jgi:hypothetical protein
VDPASVLVFGLYAISARATSTEDPFQAHASTEPGPPLHLGPLPARSEVRNVARGVVARGTFRRRKLECAERPLGERVRRSSATNRAQVLDFAGLLPCYAGVAASSPSLCANLPKFAKRQSNASPHRVRKARLSLLRHRESGGRPGPASGATLCTSDKFLQCARNAADPLHRRCDGALKPRCA